MATLSDSDYKKWIEETDDEDDIILSDPDQIERLQKELSQVKKELKTKQEEVVRLKKRNELLTHLVRGKSIRLE